MTLSTREILKLASGYGRKAKFRNVPTEVDGIRFDSRAEARRYGELKLLERAGEIHGLTLQPLYVFEFNGVKIGSYKADFRYERSGVVVVEDVKSSATKTPAYQLRKRMMLAFHGISILETR